MIRAGLVLQVVFLILVDWGTIAGMRGGERVPWIHVAGLIAVNAVLLVAAGVAWRWMRRIQARADAEMARG
jgi:hypothetical protein